MPVFVSKFPYPLKYVGVDRAGDDGCIIWEGVGDGRAGASFGALGHRNSRWRLAPWGSYAKVASARGGG